MSSFALRSAFLNLFIWPLARPIGAEPRPTFISAHLLSFAILASSSTRLVSISEASHGAGALQGPSRLLRPRGRRSLRSQSILIRKTNSRIIGLIRMAWILQKLRPSPRQYPSPLPLISLTK